MANETVNTSSIISKLTIRSMAVVPARHIHEGKTTPVARIYGMATGVKDVVDKVRGEIFQSITGTFEGVNIETGKVYQSSVLYLPSGIHGMLHDAVSGVLDGQSVDFALEIGVVKASNAAGYSYEGMSLLPAKAVDPLAEMRSKLLALNQSKTIDAAPALPEPKAEELILEASPKVEAVQAKHKK